MNTVTVRSVTMGTKMLRGERESERMKCMQIRRQNPSVVRRILNFSVNSSKTFAYNFRMTFATITLPTY